MTSITAPSTQITGVASKVGSSDPLKDVEGRFVIDAAGNLLWLQTTYDNITGNTTTTYYDQPNGTVVTPSGNVGPVKDSNIFTIKRCDDINGDGTSLVVFYRVNVYDEAGVIISSIPQTPSGAAYTVQGVERDCDDDIEKDVDEINQRVSGSFINFNFDKVDLTYVASGAAEGEINTAVYSLSGNTAGTITMSYDAQGRLSSVSRT